MKRLLIGFCVAAIILPQATWANPKSDSLRAFTGAPRAKFVWPRITWADDHYKGLSSSRTDLLLFDTDEGKERVLVSGVGGLSNVYSLRISRSGRRVIWNDLSATKTYILDLTSPSSAPRVLLDKSSCTFWCAHAFAADQTTGIEYLYCLDNFTPTSGNGIYKLPLNADGTANTAGATKINYQGGGGVDEALSVSADGKKLGGAFPWPNTMILDIATGRLDGRHNGNFGCQANIAPDNSYRFFHCQDDHSGINMWDAAMSTNWWPVTLINGVPGLPSGTPTDFAEPRWTNHLQFFTVSYPMLMGYDDPPDDSGPIKSLAGMDSAAIVKLRMWYIPSNLIGKFSADFKTVAQYMTIAGNDVRHKDKNGDGWLSSGVTVGSTAAAPGMSRPADPRFIRSNGNVIVNSPANARVYLTDAQGRQVRQWAGGRTISIDMGGLDAGVYAISAVNGGGRFTTRSVVVR